MQNKSDLEKEIKYLDINSIIPFSRNNRIHSEKQIDLIANSINEFGFNQPIVADENNIILVGHGRLEAAKKLKLKQVPILIKKDLTESQKKAYRILDNKLQNDSTWDFDNLKLELDALQDLDFDLNVWGLDVLLPEDTSENEAEDDDYSDSSTGDNDTFLKIGDVIELGKHRLVCGDSTNPEVWSLLCEKKIDLIITDPPYGVSYVGKTKDALTIENDSLDEESLALLFSSVCDCIDENLREGASIYVAIPAGLLRLVFEIELHKREWLRQELIWNKNAMVMGRSDYHYKHEPILYGWKPGSAHYFTSDRTKTSVIDCKKPHKSTEHPTMKPLELWAEFIKNSSKKNQIVCDPFLGSGTTLLASDQLDRVCYGIELSPKYCHVIIDRYKKHCEKVNKPFICKINGESFSG